MTWTILDIAARYDGTEVLVLTETGDHQIIASFDQTDSGASIPWIPPRPLALNASDRDRTALDKRYDADVVLPMIRDGWNQLRLEHPLYPSGVLKLQYAHTKGPGRLVQEISEYCRYCSALKPLQQLLRPPSSKGDAGDFVSYGNVRIHEVLGGRRGSSRRASIRSDPVSQRLVYKGLSFFHYLIYGPEAFPHHINALYCEIETVCTIVPPHPNIVPPPKAFVTVAPGESNSGGEPAPSLVVGQLSGFYEQGSLASLLNRSALDRERIPLARKAKWCYQLVLAMAHVHLQARSWHQDLKPPNVLVDANDNLLLIDWEKCDANMFILAPEADGSYDVDTDGNGESLIYIPYQGPERVNCPLGRTQWNVFPCWNKSFPRAAELAEVFSLGRTIWLILEEVAQNPADSADYVSQVMRWTSRSEDIPLSWRQTIDDCVHRDPNHRIGMKALLTFWEREWASLSME